MGSCGRAFELLLLLHHFLSWVRSGSNRDGAEHAWVTARPGATPVCAPENEEATEDLSRVAPVASAIHRVLRVWSLCFVGRGLRLALDADDGPFTGEVRRAGPVVPRAHVSRDALAPGRHRRCARSRHGLYEEKPSATRARLSTCGPRSSGRPRPASRTSCRSARRSRRGAAARSAGSRAPTRHAPAGSAR